MHARRYLDSASRNMGTSALQSTKILWYDSYRRPKEAAEADRIRRANSLSWLPVFLNEANEPFVKVGGVWRAVSELENFQRCEKRRRKRLYDTARGRMVEV